MTFIIHVEMSLIVSSNWGIMTYWPTDYWMYDWASCRTTINEDGTYSCRVCAPGHLIAQWLTSLIRDGRIQVIMLLDVRSAIK